MYSPPVASRRFLLTLIVLMAGLLFGGSVSADTLSSDEAWRLMQARDDSLRSLQASLRVFMTPVSREEELAIREWLSNELSTPSNASTPEMASVSKILPSVKNLNWPRVNVYWREGKFRTTTTGISRFPFIQQWDGTRYLEIADIGARQQISLFAEATGRFRYGPAELGLCLQGRQKLADPQIKPLGAGYELVSSLVNDASIKAIKRFDRRLAVEYQASSINDEIVAESWYLRHVDQQPYAWPRFIVALRKHDSGCTLTMIIPDEIILNGRIDDRDLEIGKVYPPANLVDHRQRPPVATEEPRWIERILSPSASTGPAK